MRHDMSVVRRLFATAAAVVVAPAALAQTFGGFSPPIFPPPPPDEIRDVVLADFTNDGNVDVLFNVMVGSPLISHLFVYPGDGAGGFGAPIVTNTGVNAITVVAGDVNNDGAVDVVLGAILVVVPDGKGLKTLLGAGDGTFTVGPATTTNAINSPQEIALHDLDGDGALDVWRAKDTGGVIEPLLSGGYVHFGAGDGSFGPAVLLTSADPFMAPFLTLARVEDVDSDGDPDLVALRMATSPSRFFVTTILNEGSRTFSAPIESEYVFFLTSGPSTSFLVDADLNSDGAPEALALSESDLQLFRASGRGDGAFFEPWRNDLPEGSSGLAAADFDGDGDTDVVVLTGPAMGDHEAIFFENIEGRGLLETQRSTTLAAPGFGRGWMARVADFNNDGAPDLLGVTFNGFFLLLNQTPVTAPAAFALVSPADGAVALPAALIWPGVAPRLSWEASAGFGVEYTVTIATDAALTQVVLSQSGLTGTGFDVPAGTLAPSTTYFWTVEASNAAGATAPAVRSFTTKNPADATGDGSVGPADLFSLLGFWGFVSAP